MKQWFERKSYGYGWTPVTWQGWLSTFLVILSIIFSGLSTTFAPTLPIALISILQVIISVGLLMAICTATGPTPKWQWGTAGKSGKRKK